MHSSFNLTDSLESLKSLKPLTVVITDGEMGAEQVHEPQPHRSWST